MKYLLIACLLLPLSAQAFCLGEVNSQRTNSLGETEYRNNMGQLVGTAKENSLRDTEYRNNMGQLEKTSHKNGLGETIYYKY